MEDGKQDFKTRTVRILRVFAGIAGAVILAGAAIFFPVSAEEAEESKTAEKQAEYFHGESSSLADGGKITFEITPETIIPPSLPANCTSDVFVVDNILISCNITDYIGKAEEKVGSFIPFNQYTASMFKVGKGINIYPKELWQNDRYGDFVVLRIALDQPKLKKSPFPFYVFEQYSQIKLILSNKQLNLVGKIFNDRDIDDIFIYPIIGTQVSLAKMYPDYSFSVYRQNQKETRILYNAYFEEIKNDMNITGSVYGIYLYIEGKTGFYLFYDTQDRLKEFIKRAVYLFSSTHMRGYHD